MFVSDCLDVNAQGHLTIGGLDTVELAKEFGTPVYICLLYTSDAADEL